MKKEKTTITLGSKDVAMVFKPNNKIQVYLPDTKKDIPYNAVATLIAVNLIENGDARILNVIDEVIKEIEESEGYGE